MKKLHSYRMSEETIENIKQIKEREKNIQNETEIIETSIELANIIESIINEHYKSKNVKKEWRIYKKTDILEMAILVKRAYEQWK